MTDQTPELLPRLLANNALRADQSKHLQLNQRADSKASMILSASSLIITITLLQYARLHQPTVLILARPGLLAILFSILATIPPLHASGETNLVYFRSFSELDKEQFKHQVKQTIADKEALYNAYIHKIYYLVKHRLSREYALIRGELLCLPGLISATHSVLIHRFAV